MLLALTLGLAMLIAATQSAVTHPGSGAGYEGWTGEVSPGLGNPHHVQAAHGGGHLYFVADQGDNVYLYRASDENTINWSMIGQLDVNPSRTARNAYIDVEGSNVAVSFTELINGRWATVVKVSNDRGSTWRTWYDANPRCNNYEAHVDICDNRIHCAYASDYPGPGYPIMEVYYLRFSMTGELQLQTPATDNTDGIAANYPCIEATSRSFANIYYSHGNGPLHPIWEAYTYDWGGTWNRGEIIPTGSLGSPGIDFCWPEVGVWSDGGDRRKMVVAEGDNAGTYCIYYRRYFNGFWEEEHHLTDLGNDNPYPQICTRGTDVLVVFRQSGGSMHTGVGARLNSQTGEGGGWNHIEDLFYLNLSYDNSGSVDCCTDGQRFFAASAGTGAHNRILVKREDTTDPTVSINDPGTYHNADFKVTATASDDFNHTADSLLSPRPEHYDKGILHADYYYKKSGSGTTWLGWPAAQGGTRDADAPWSKTFPGATAAEGSYDFRVVVTDTADRVSENILTGVIVDRSPPTGVNLQISAPDGDNGWYISQPGEGPGVAAQDAVSGVKCAYYRFDDASDWTVYSQPFELPEGHHQIHYYAEDKAGNASAVKTFSYKADFTDPTGAVTSPDPEGYFRTDMKVEATCRDDLSGVESITWLVDGKPKKTTHEPKTSLDLSDLVDGQHSLEAEIKDAAGRRGRTRAVVFYKDVTPPTVELIEPTGEKWVRGMVTVKADIKDNLKVGRAEFYVDGEMIDRRTSAPWTAAWDTSTAKNGYHALRVKAWDAAGNRAEVTVSGEKTVYVGNNISETNHFAEGCTRAGFDTWLCLQNPGDEHAEVTVNYYLGEGQGSASTRTYSLPPHSRSTVYVNADVGADKDVSIQVTSSKPIVSERPMYFDYQGTAAHHWQGGHTAQGAHFPREQWCFAEGCTRPGFETWLCLQNPEGREAWVKVEYMMENGATLDRAYRLAPWSRGTVLVNREVGEGHDVSMRVTSDSPIVAERPVYFLYQGMWDGGHNVMGAAQPEREWYFAEGCTRTGFNQWICLMNPNQEAAAARIVYVMEDGGRIEREYVLAPRSRFTVNVNNDVARQHDVSTYITSDPAIVVERPMYFLYNSVINEGSNAMGVCRPGSSWYLAEGCTRAGFEEWICLMNPGEEAAEVILRFMLEDSSEREHQVTVPPHTRVTVKVNDVVGPDHDVSAEVMSDQPVIVERPMYSMYRGSCPSGDTLSGYTFNP